MRGVIWGAFGRALEEGMGQRRPAAGGRRTLARRALTPAVPLPPLPSILHTLRVRYELDMIYTYSGNILIAVGRGGEEGREGTRRPRARRRPPTTMSSL